MKIKRKDGTIAEVDDGYILRDGETLSVGLMLMDARRGMVHDGHGNVAGMRPGFLFYDNEQDDLAREDAYRQYATDISERWRGRQKAGNGSNQTPPEPQTFANPEAARAAAYAEYNRTIQERWRR